MAKRFHVLGEPELRPPNDLVISDGSVVCTQAIHKQKWKQSPHVLPFVTRFHGS